MLSFCFLGCFSIHGPGTVSGPEGGSVTIECHYNSGWETYKKWWGRGNAWHSCRILVKTTGSKQEVKKDRVSIKDDHRCRTFAVTMEKLRSDDEDTYWCGIERYGIDRGVQVKVTIDPGRNYSLLYSEALVLTPRGLRTFPLSTPRAGEESRNLPRVHVLVCICADECMCVCTWGRVHKSLGRLKERALACSHISTIVTGGSRGQTRLGQACPRKAGPLWQVLFCRSVGHSHPPSEQPQPDRGPSQVCSEGWRARKPQS